MPKRLAYLDGSNLVLGLGRKKESSGVFYFSVMLRHLIDLGFACTALFDKSIFDKLRQRSAPEEEINLLERLIHASDGQLARVGYTDDLLLSLATQTSGCVISHRDKYRTWTRKTQLALPSVIRVGKAGSRLAFTSEDNSFSIPDVEIPVSVKLFGQSVVDGQPNNSQYEESDTLNHSVELAPGDDYSPQGRLIVFVLDASGSMWREADGANETYDGKLKSDHLNQVLRDTIARFSRAAARNSLYVSIVSFAGNATVRSINNKQMLNISEASPPMSSGKFNYLENVHGNGTNIAEALQVSVNLIDSVLRLPSNLALHDEWHALIVLITDGKHTGNAEEVVNLARHTAITRTTLVNGNIRVACVGIGKDCDTNLLSSISSHAEASELTRLRRAGLAELLVGDNLVVLVNEKKSNYAEVIRTFVDIVTQTV
jgi:uncharacterized protein YegL